MSKAQKKKETVFPSEIIAAIKHARKNNPKDKFGDGAFKLSFKHLRPGNNGTRWTTLSVLKKRPNGKWEYIPLLLRNINLNTTSRIKSEEEKKEAKQDYPGIYIGFNTSSAYERKLRKNGKVVGEIEEPYGKAKELIAKAFRRLVTNAVKAGDFYNDNSNVKLNVQFHRWVNKAKGQKEKLEKSIIRVKIPFDGHGKELTVPKIKVYDVEKKDKTKKNGFPYELATWDDQPLDYHTIRKFITTGSSCSFIEDLSGVCLSSQGISNPSKAKDFLMVKRGKGRRIDAEDVFDADDFADIDGGEAGYDDESSGNDDNDDNAENVEGDDEFDELANALDAEQQEAENALDETANDEELDDDLDGGDSSPADDPDSDVASDDLDELDDI